MEMRPWKVNLLQVLSWKCLTKGRTPVVTVEFDFGGLHPCPGREGEISHADKVVLRSTDLQKEKDFR